MTKTVEELLAEWRAALMVACAAAGETKEAADMELMDAHEAYLAAVGKDRQL